MTRQDSPAAKRLRIGDWSVDTTSGEISRDGQVARLETRTLRLLLCLAAKPGDVFSIGDLLDQVWPDVTVSSDSVYQAVASLRRVLGDDSRQPAYIATVPRFGYRMVASVATWSGEGAATIAEAAAVPDKAAAIPPSVDPIARGWSRRPILAVAAGVGLCVALVAALLTRGGAATNRRSASAAAQPEQSIAVLPFLDLTEGMKQEEFADGVTEELIDALSKVPKLRVPAPTSSFYFKGKKMPIADIARTLGVAYVLDGSVRKSGATLRIAARLVRADSGYIVWSETYDRASGDVLKVQADIAAEVTSALTSSIGAALPHARSSDPQASSGVLTARNR